MERKQVVAMLSPLYRKIKKRRNNRIHWEHPLITLRQDFGAFYTIFPKLREHEDNFFNNFRLSMKSFDELYMKLMDRLQRQVTFMRECIQPIQMLAVTAHLIRKTTTKLSKNNRYSLAFRLKQKLNRACVNALIAFCSLDTCLNLIETRSCRGGIRCSTVSIRYRIETEAWSTVSHLSELTEKEPNRMEPHVWNRPYSTNSLDSLAHLRTISALSLYYRYYHGVCSVELKSIIPL